ncbi:MAG: hypothetical protein MUC38_08705 [Cyclobacteriaceae bacterium]|jgi:hypothetical protein|nr:hypothetical protein [Cyclobacteriaceae bacterium]
MKLLRLLGCVVACAVAWPGAQAQPAAAKALEQKDLTLKDRYAAMKNNSQTFQDYKVIKEYILDGVWKIYLDSVAAQKQALAAAHAKIQGLEKDVSELKRQMAAQQAAVEDITFASTHLTVLGVSFHKTTFVLLAAAAVGALIFALVSLLARMRLLAVSVREKAESFAELNRDYEEYKRKSMEKQMKLARELQNERNKLMELRPH